MTKISKRAILLFFAVSVILGASFLIFTSWRSVTIANLDDYSKWLNDESNHCVASRSIAGVKTFVKYQPPLYLSLKNLAHQQLEPNSKSRVLDSLVALQKNEIVFLMTIGPDKEVSETQRASSLMSEGIGDYGEYVQRVLSTNFSMDQHISLFVDGEKYKPALCVLENLYELSEDRTFTVVFVSEGKQNINKGSDYVFEYSDPFFKMGKVQYNFSSKNLSKAKNIHVINN